MNLSVATLGLLILLVPNSSSGQGRPLAKSSAPLLRKLFIEPSSTALLGGTASLIITPLNRQMGAYVGAYQLKVSPYFFKSEKGKLSMIFSDQSLRKLTQGLAAEFTGEARTNGSNKTRAINARATPSANDRGSLTFSVTTENGKLVFNTSYRFGEK